MTKRRDAFNQTELGEKLGLSQAAVSMALRDDPRLPEATRARVRAAAEAAGYRPQSAGSLLAARRWRRSGAGRSPVIAFLDTRLADGETNSLVPPVRAHAERLGYRVEVLRPWRFRSSAHLTQTLRRRGIEGVLLSQQVRGEAPHALDWEHFCVVACGFLAAAPAAACVRADLAACAEATLAHLPERAPVVLWLRETPGLRSEEQLNDAARVWMRRHGGRRRVRWVLDDGRETGGAAAEARAALAELGEEAWLVASYARMAREAGKKGRRVCVFLDEDKDVAAEEAVPGPSVDYDAVAAASVALLDSKLRANERGLPERPPTLMIPPRWREA